MSKISLIKKLLRYLGYALVRYFTSDEGIQGWSIDSGFPEKIIDVEETAWGGVEVSYSDSSIAGEPNC